jgi:hypothetical protein
MLHPILRTLVKVAVASLVVGTILAHFGITAEQLMHEFGLSADRIEDYAQKGFAWAWPNVLLGSLVIVPIWFLVYLFRPAAGAANSPRQAAGGAGSAVSGPGSGIGARGSGP